jgi:hypothetical protein
MAFDLGRKCHPQHAPRLLSFPPGFDFLDLEARQRHQERRVQVSPHGIAVEVSHGVFSMRPAKAVRGLSRSAST